MLTRIYDEGGLQQNENRFLPQIKDGFAVQYRDGDILIGVMIPQHVATVQKTCGEVEPFGVQYLEAVNMLIEKVSTGLYFAIFAHLPVTSSSL